MSKQMTQEQWDSLQPNDVIALQEQPKLTRHKLVMKNHLGRWIAWGLNEKGVPKETATLKPDPRPWTLIERAASDRT